MNILSVSVVSLMLFAGSQICGCGSCKASAQTPIEKGVSKSEPKEVTLKITGMTCAGCTNSIHSALSETNGVIKNEVKYPGNIAIIKYDASKTSVAELIKVIEKTGYKAEVQKDKKSQA
ncbi:cation transporter [Daejeonella sp.]|uniref:heavy-metal-associated domain-containing protein n=1 Tax=Daejeonella sp. TaxID=2805397 RepID=UPI0030C20689